MGAEKERSWYVYLLECERGKLYTGITPDVEARYGLHAAGKGGSFTRANRPVRIVGACEYPDHSSAAIAEAALKKTPRHQKLLWASAHSWSKDPGTMPNDSTRGKRVRKTNDAVAAIRDGRTSSAEAAFLESWRRASGGDRDGIEAALCSADPRLGRVIAEVISKVGPQRFEPSDAASHFEAIARSIVYQQLSGKAAARIYGRLVAALGGELTPERATALDADELKAAGLSSPKARYVRALAEAVAEGTLRLDGIELLPDGEIIAALTRVPGIGIWTAQMFLMFRLGRADVLPASDLGIRKGLQLAHGLRNPAALGYVERVGKRWVPYRSIACVYLWAALDLKLASEERPRRLRRKPE